MVFEPKVTCGVAEKCAILTYSSMLRLQIFLRLASGQLLVQTLVLVQALLVRAFLIFINNPLNTWVLVGASVNTSKRVGTDRSGL
jgi:hypothetical protein